MNRVLLVVMVFMTTPLAFAQYNPASDFRAEPYGNGVRILEFTGSGTVVRIPPTMHGLPVTHIGDRAFISRGLTSVTIPNNVTSIGRNAFHNNQLTSVVIPDSVTYIRVNAFRRNRLTSVTIGNSVTYIEAGAFRDNQLTSVTIPNSVTTIRGNRCGGGGFGLDEGGGAFQNNRLTNVVIPDSVTGISWNTFRNNQLTSVTIPNSVTHIGPGAFRDNQLTSITIPNSVTTIDGVGFHDNLGGAFQNNRLTSVVIPDSVRTIREMAFIDNPLTSITIGANVTIMSEGYYNFMRQWRSAFCASFTDAYNNGGRLAGTYTRPDVNWMGWTREESSFAPISAPNNSHGLVCLQALAEILRSNSD